MKKITSLLVTSFIILTCSFAHSLDLATIQRVHTANENATIDEIDNADYLQYLAVNYFTSEGCLWITGKGLYGDDLRHLEKLTAMSPRRRHVDMCLYIEKQIKAGITDLAIVANWDRAKYIIDGTDFVVEYIQQHPRNFNM
jgi:hypothetical protein